MPDNETARHLRRCLSKYGASWADYDSWGNVMAIHSPPSYDGAELVARIAERICIFARAGHAYAQRDHDVTTDGAHPNNGLLIDLGPADSDDHTRMVELAERGRTSQ